MRNSCHVISRDEEYDVEERAKKIAAVVAMTASWLGLNGLLLLLFGFSCLLRLFPSCWFLFPLSSCCDEPVDCRAACCWW